MLKPKSPQSSFFISSSYLYNRVVPQCHLTGTSVVSDSGGALVSSISYMPFGSTRSGSVPTDIKFTGQRLDGTGLYYYGARYYDPTIGRFISADTFVQRADGFDIISSPLTVNLVPEGLGDVLAPQKDYPAVSLEVPTNPQALNRYSYVLNNPLRYTDPSGWDTKGHGFNISLGFGVGISFEILRVTDDSGNKAWAVTLSFLGTTPNLGGGYQYQETNAETVNNLAGLSGGGGASTGLIKDQIPSGVEYVGYKKNEEGGWQGLNINIGPQLAPVEVHATIGWTWVLFRTSADPEDNGTTGPSVSLPIGQDNSNSQYEWESDYGWWDWEYWYYDW